MPGFKSLLFIALSILCAKFLCAAPIVLHVDNTHSSIQFSVSFVSVTEVNGRFDRFYGRFYYDEANSAASKIELFIDASSINTGLKIRDRDLINKYLECSSFPIIYFKSRSVVSSNKRFVVTGDLKLHGVTKEVQLVLTVFGDVVNGEGGRELGLKMRPLVLNRKDYKIMENSMGSGAIGDSVTTNGMMRVRDLTPYRKDFDVKYPTSTEKGDAPFQGNYAGKSGKQVSLINDGENYFVSFNDGNWTWFAQALSIGKNKYKLTSFSHLIEITSEGLSYTQGNKEPEMLAKIP